MANEIPRWYVIDGNAQLVFLEEDKFFRAGNGKGEHLRFWDPVKSKICRAEFNGISRPRPYSPPPNASYNVEGALGSCETGSEGKGNFPEEKEQGEGAGWGDEWLANQPQTKLGSRHPVRFKAKSGETVKSQWAHWQMGQKHYDGDPEDDPPRVYFWLSHERKRLNFCSWQLPVVFVDTCPAETKSAQSAQFPSVYYCFRSVSGVIVRTDEHKWIPCGRGSRPFLVMEYEEQAYMATALPTLEEIPYAKQEARSKGKETGKGERRGKPDLVGNSREPTRCIVPLFTYQ